MLIQGISLQIKTKPSSSTKTDQSSLMFHFTHDAGMPSRSSTKELHISTVCSPPSQTPQKLTIKFQAEEILNKQSGWKSLTGTTDFGTISSSSDPQCKLAFDIFIDRILGYIGSYYVSLEGKVDALVFAGGIGEKGSLLRAKVIEKCRCIGFEIDDERNGKAVNDVVQDIGKEGARHRTLVCKTDEQVCSKYENKSLILEVDESPQFEMARGTAADPKLLSS